MDSILHKSLTKIDDQAKLQTREPEVRKYLASKHLVLLGDRVTFKNDFSLYLDINPKR